MAMLFSVIFVWLTSTTSTKMSSIKSPNYALTYEVDNTELSSTGNDTYTMNSNSCTILLIATGTENASGYYAVNIDDTDYYTEQIVINSDTNNEYTITIDSNTVNASTGTSTGTTIFLTSKWGKLPSTTNMITITPYNNSGNGISLTSLQGQEPAVEKQQELTGTEQSKTDATVTPTPKQNSTEETKTGTQETETKKQFIYNRH